MAAQSLRGRALLSTTMLVGALTGYARRAYAACVNSGGSTYQCSGANTTTQTINAANATVSTLPGFSVNTTGTGGNAITITGDGALSYTDLNLSPLTAAATALFIQSTGNAGVTPGSVTVETNGNLIGGNFGIYARNRGSGALAIATNGDVVGTSGILARNYGTDLNLTTGAGSTVSGSSTGIYAATRGSGALTITANGDVTSTEIGINAQNFGTGFSLTTGAGTRVSGNNRYGILARNYGGALRITLNGDVAGGIAGIFARSVGTELSLITGAGSRVTGGSLGIDARRNYGSGTLRITVNGDVTGRVAGIYARSAAVGQIAITVGPGGSVTSTGGQPDFFAINILGGPANLTVAGTLNGGGGGFNAVQFDQSFARDDRFELQPGATVNGRVLAGPGTDAFVLGGTGQASFNVGLIGPGQQYQDFELFSKTGDSTWTLTGSNTTAMPWTVEQGTLVVNGSIPNSTVIVNNGGTLAGTGTVGPTTIMSGGTFAPGNSPGTMTVVGNLVFQSGALYVVQVNPSTASSTNVTAGGTATLAGTVQANFASGSYISRAYTILSAAGGRSGTFDALSTVNLPANFTAELTYTATAAILNIIAALPPTTPVAAALDIAFNKGQPLPAAFVPVFELTGQPLVTALTELGGEAATGAQQVGFQLMNQFLDLMLDPSSTAGAASPARAGRRSRSRPSARNCPTTSRWLIPRC
jgi:hypothetical protein